MKVLITLITSMILLIIFLPFSDAIEAGTEFKDIQSFNDYTIRIYFIAQESDVGAAFFEILKGDKLIYKQDGESPVSRFQIGYDDENQLIKIGRDITGDGHPNLVIMEWTRGAHCCYYYHIFDISRTFRKIATLNAGNSDGFPFKDIDKDSSLEFITADWTFEYWKTSFAQSPAPKIILGFQNGAYQIRKDLMCKKAPSLEELKEKAEKSYFINDKGYPNSDLWGYMLDLIYSCNADLVNEFVEMAWSSNIPGKNEFLQEFYNKLSESSYSSEFLTE